VAEENRVVCTHDLDFSDLLAVSGRDRPSLVTVRIPNPSPEFVASRLRTVLPTVADDLEQGCVVTIGEETVRIRALPIGGEEETSAGVCEGTAGPYDPESCCRIRVRA